MSSDWAFVPTDAELESLNALRLIVGLDKIDNITTAQQWFDACSEIDLASIGGE